MTQADAQKPAPEPVKTPSFKSRYKLHGMIAAVVLMWLDFAYIYQALIANDAGAVTVGMIVMFAAAATAYYFG